MADELEKLRFAKPDPRPPKRRTYRKPVSYPPPESERLKYGKPVRVVDDRLLRNYCKKFPRCEIRGCRHVPCPEPHHLIPRARGRDDRHEGLVRLSWGHHREYEILGGRRFLEKYQDRMEPELIQKIRRALRMEN